MHKNTGHSLLMFQFEIKNNCTALETIKSLILQQYWDLDTDAFCDVHGNETHLLFTFHKFNKFSIS